MIEQFTQKSIVVVLDVAGVHHSRDSKPTLFHVKKAFVDCIAKLDAGDLVYVHSPRGDLKMFDSPSIGVAGIANYVYTDINPVTALAESVFLVNSYENSKYVFYVTDHFHDNFAGLMRKVIRNNNDCGFYFYGITVNFPEKITDFDNVCVHNVADSLNLYELVKEDFDKLWQTRK